MLSRYCYSHDMGTMAPPDPLLEVTELSLNLGHLNPMLCSFYTILHYFQEIPLPSPYLWPLFLPPCGLPRELLLKVKVELLKVCRTDTSSSLSMRKPQPLPLASADFSGTGVDSSRGEQPWHSKVLLVRRWVMLRAEAMV